MPKLALITGTGKGIGKSLAEILLNNNYKVIGYSRKNRILHPHFTFIKIDLNDLEKIKTLILPKSDKGDVLFVNNAATIGTITPFDKKAPEDIIAEYQVNLIAPTLLSQKFIHTYKGNSKILINISSGAGDYPIPSWSTYCATKAGLSMLTKVINEEDHKNLNALSVSPGIVDTNMQKKIRSSTLDSFSLVNKFINYYKNNELENTEIVAKKLYYIIQNINKFTENIISIRDVNIK